MQLKNRPKNKRQRVHQNGQQAHEKMLNIAFYFRNENKNYNEVSPHTNQNGYNLNTGKGVEKRESSYSVGGSVNWHSHYGKQYQFSSVQSFSRV